MRGVLTCGETTRHAATRAKLQPAGCRRQKARLTPGAYYAFHLDVLCRDGNAVRVSVSNLYKAAARSAGGAVRLPLQADSSKWGVVAVDLGGALDAFCGGAELRELKAVQFCASMAVRNVFTSDEKYSPETLPRELQLPYASGMRAEVGGEGSAPLWSWLPCEPTMPAPAREPELPRKPEVPRQASAPASPGLPLDAGEAVRVERLARGPTAEPPAAVEAIYASQRTPAALPAKALVGASDPYVGTSLRPDPMMSLERVVGCSGERSRNLACAPDGTSLVFGSASTVVVMDAATGQQRFLTGHTAGICAASFNAAGTLLATAQEGKPAVVRLWDFKSGACVAILCGHERDVTALDISADGRCLAAVGTDKGARQAVVVWDITRVLVTGEAPIVVKHGTEYNVRALRFSPFEEDRLVTCGRDSIRFYRLKNGQLRGCSVQLGEHRTMQPKVRAGADRVASGARNMFTDLAFEAGYGLTKLSERHVFVATASGAVFQVNYGKRNLEAVYQLHNAAINSLIINEGFCITGSDDRFLRMWPVDFSDYFLEAEHETAVTAVGVTPDGLAIAALTAGGSVGVLDVPSHRYRTLLRSHTDSVFDVAVDPNRAEVTTVSADGSIRVWALDTMEQLYQFDAPDELAACVAYHPTQHCIGVGFDNGITRVFDVPSTGLVQEHHQHRAAVVDIAFTPDARLMLSAGADGNICVFDVGQGYLPTRFVATCAPDAATGVEPSLRRMSMAVSPDSLLLAASGPDVGTVLIFASGDLTPRARMVGSPAGVVCVRFTPDSRELITTTADRRLERFDVHTGALLVSTPPLHGATLETLDVSYDGRFIAVGCADGIVHVYESSLASTGPRAPPPRQSFVGHVDYITRLRFSPDSNRIVTVGGCDSIYVWSFLGCDAELNPPLPDFGAVVPGSDTEFDVLGLGAPEDLGPEEDPNARLDTAVSSALEKMALSGRMPTGVDLFELEKELRAEASPLAEDTAAAKEVFDWLRPAAEDEDALAAGAPVEAAAAAPGRAEAVPAYPVAPPAAEEAPAVHYAAPEGAGKMALGQVVGYNGGARKNVLWHPLSGTVFYSWSSIVVIEDLLSREQTYLRRLQAAVQCMALSPDGSVLASGHVGAMGMPAAICLWDVATRECRATFDAHMVGVQLLEFSHDGSLLLSTGTAPEAVVALYSVVDGTEISRAEAPAMSYAACWRPGARMPEFVTAGHGALSLWRLPPADGSATERDLLVCELAPPSPSRTYTAVAFTDPGSFFVGDSTGSVHLVALGATAVAKRELPVLAGAVGSIVVCGHTMVVAGEDERIIIWTRGEEEDSWEGSAAINVGASVSAMVLDAACVEGVVGTAAGDVKYINTLEGQVVALSAGHSAAVTCLQELPEAGALMTGLASGVVALWSTDSFTRLVELEAGDGSPDQAVTAVLARGGGDFVIVGRADGSVHSFSVREAAVAAVLSCGKAAVVSLSWLDEEAGRLLAVDAACDALALDAETLTPFDRSDVLRLGGTDELHMTVTSDGLLAAAYDGAACVAALDTHTLAPGASRRFAPPSGARGMVAFAPPAMARSTLLFASSAAAEVQFWDFTADVVTRRLSVAGVPRSLAASPDGQYLCLGTLDRLVRLVSLGDATWEDCLVHSKAVGTVTFLSDGNRLVSAAGDEVALWHVL